ncbi:radical SAM/SPASM domain-containing protein [Acidobacteriota bacterium]
MIQVLPRIPGFWLFRRFGFPHMLPLNLTISVTNRCNSRCKTCNVYLKEVDEFSLREFEETFKSIGRAPYWVTISGGEPFLRKDITEICRFAYDSFRPGIINIPTNGILSGIVPGRVKEIVENSPDAEVIINLSLDHLGEKHDTIRGVPGNYAMALETYRKLKELGLPNLTVGIHTVISKFNVQDFPDIYRGLSAMEPDSYITEIAEERVELGTTGLDLTPSRDMYDGAVDFLSDRIREKRYRGITKITQAFRLRYYELVKQIMEKKRQVLPCYAGFISAQISPDGEVWACCIQADSMGNLRDVDYDFGRIWFSEQADKVRAPIRKKMCFCPLANAGYTNMLVSPGAMAKVLKNLVIPS